MRWSHKCLCLNMVQMLHGLQVQSDRDPTSKGIKNPSRILCTVMTSSLFSAIYCNKWKGLEFNPFMQCKPSLPAHQSQGQVLGYRLSGACRTPLLDRRGNRGPELEGDLPEATQ